MDEGSLRDFLEFVYRRTIVYFKYEALLQELEELERLAKIGKATEQAYSNGLQVESAGGWSPVFETIDELLKWAESEGE